MNRNECIYSCLPAKPGTPWHGCGHRWHSPEPLGPTQCPVCGNEWVRWENYERWVRMNPLGLERVEVGLSRVEWRIGPPAVGEELWKGVCDDLKLTAQGRTRGELIRAAEEVTEDLVMNERMKK